jgi:hypothetical protein
VLVVAGAVEVVDAAGAGVEPDFASPDLASPDFVSPEDSDDPPSFFDGFVEE